MTPPNDGAVNDLSYGKILATLKEGLGEKDVLVVDDVSDADDWNRALSALPCLVVITTRLSNSLGQDQFGLRISRPELDACVAIFEYFYDDELDVEERGTVEEIVSAANQNTMVVRLLGKQAAASGLTVRELRDDMVKSGSFDFSLSMAEEIQGRDLSWGTFERHMDALYDCSAIASRVGDELLRCLSVLSVKGIRKRDLKKWCGLESLNDINALINAGWLEDEGRQRVSMHDEVASVLGRRLHPDRANTRSLATRLANLFNEGRNVRDMSELSALLAQIIHVCRCVPGQVDLLIESCGEARLYNLEQYAKEACQAVVDYAEKIPHAEPIQYRQVLTEPVTGQDAGAVILPRLAALYALWSDLARGLNSLEESVAYGEKALMVLDAAPSFEAGLYLSVCSGVGVSYCLLHDEGRATSILERAQGVLAKEPSPSKSMLLSVDGLAFCLGTKDAPGPSGLSIDVMRNWASRGDAASIAYGYISKAKIEVLEGNFPAAIESARFAIERLRNGREADPVSLAEYLSVLGRAYAGGGLSDDAERCLELALENKANASEKSAHDWSSFYTYLLDALSSVDNECLTEKIICSMLDSLGDFEGKLDPIDAALLSKHAASVLADKGGKEGALECARTSILYYEKSSRISPDKLADVYFSAVSIAEDANELELAKEWIEKEIAILEASSRVEDVVACADEHLEASFISHDLGDIEGEIKHLSRAISIFESHEPSSPNLAISYELMIIWLMQNSDYGSARELINKKINIDKIEGDAEVLAHDYDDLAVATYNLGDIDAAIRHSSTAMSFYESYLDSSSPKLANGYRMLADELTRKGDFESAKGFLEKKLIIDENEGDLETLIADYGKLAFACRELGETGQFEKYDRKQQSLKVKRVERSESDQ